MSVSPARRSGLAIRYKSSGREARPCGLSAPDCSDSGTSGSLTQLSQHLQIPVLTVAIA
ncbi:MAG: hypothetical protein IM588_07940 [Cytophagales bacterium]|nr:hypothetical protein [Cytophagales bacterium]